MGGEKHLPAGPSGGAIFMGYGGTWAASLVPCRQGQVLGMRSWLHANLMKRLSSSWEKLSRACQKNSMWASVSTRPTWYMVCAWQKGWRAYMRCGSLIVYILINRLKGKVMIPFTQCQCWSLPNLPGTRQEISQLRYINTCVIIDMPSVNVSPPVILWHVPMEILYVNMHKVKMANYGPQRGQNHN